MRATRANRGRRSLVVTAAALTSAALMLAGCSPSSNSDSTSASTSDKPVTYALMPSQGPNWIAPINPPDKMVTSNTAIHAVMWPRLIDYNGVSGRMELDKKSSAVSDYKFSDDNTSVEMTLGDLTWADNGSPVTSRDVEFAHNLITANAEEWGSYSKGAYPVNVKTFLVKDDKTFTITFDKAYNQQYILANQLALITPMPQHAWDKTSADGAIGDHDKTTDGAKAVWKFIQGQSKDIASYATNPMWQAVSGPYKVKSWSQDGSVTIVANDKYTGPDKAQITTVNFKPYTSNDAEMNDLRAKGIDYGYITASQLDSQSQFTDLGFEVVPWAGWSITYMPYNFANPTMGPVFKQLYVRQGLQSAVDQVTISEKIWKGSAKPGYGPVPQNPASDFVSEKQTNNPYPYDLTKAAAYFTDNGWTKGSDGILSCTDAAKCGEGIAAGTKMKITFMTQNGSQETDNQMAAIKSAYSEIGVDVTIQSATLESVLTEAQKCKSGSDCSWQFVYFGTAGSWYFPAYPTGDKLFSADAKWNAGQYKNEEAFTLIDETLVSSDSSAMQKYSALLAEDLPVLWMPNPVYQVSVVNKDLNIGTQDPLGSFFPQRWSWK